MEGAELQVLTIKNSEQQTTWTRGEERSANKLEWVEEKRDK